MTTTSALGLVAAAAVLAATGTLIHHRRRLYRRQISAPRQLLPNEALMPVIADDLRSGHTVTMSVRGYSMRPLIEHERDKVLLAAVDRPLRRGDVILAEYAPKRYALHRLIRITPERITMQGDGNPYQTETFPPEAVMGRALGFYRRGSDKLLSVDSWQWRAYSHLWMALTPVRRYLLGLHRRLWFPLFR